MKFLQEQDMVKRSHKFENGCIPMHCGGGSSFNVSDVLHQPQDSSVVHIAKTVVLILVTLHWKSCVENDSLCCRENTKSLLFYCGSVHTVNQHHIHFYKKKLKCHSRTLIRTLDKLYYCKILSAEIRYGIKCQNVSVDALGIKSPSAILERPRDASCLSVVSFSSTIPRALSFIYLRQRSR